MITCKLIIKETPGKGYYIDMFPDQSDATGAEMRAAVCLDVAIRAAMMFMQQKAETGQMIEGKDMAALERVIAQKIKDFES